MTLTAIHRPRRERTFLVYDLEWIPGTLEVRMVGVYDGARYRCYRTVDQFLDGELTHRNRGVWFYAHAGGLADLQFVVDRVYERCLENPAWSLDAKFSGSAAIIAKIRHCKHSWLFLDSFWLFRDSLKNIGKSMGMDKGEAGADPDEVGITDEEFERRKRLQRNWYATAPWDELRTYNEQDCRILWYAIDRFQTELMDLGGELQMTIASTGMNLFRRKYLTQQIEPHSYVNECAVHAYAASRVEKFADSVENANYYDINSSFPYAMTFPAPGEFLGSAYSLPEYDERNLFLADCEVEVPSIDVPPLAYRLKSRVFFPSGKWRNWFCNIDLEQLEKEGGKILAVHEVLRFGTFEDLGAYSTDIYTRRKNTQDPFRRIVYKYLLNCLYGKFAEMTEKEMLLINPPNVPITREQADSMRMRQWLPGAWLQTTVKEVPHRLVPIATHITAIARRTLGNLLSMSRDRYYCDTDGFATKELHETDSELGGLKLEKMIREGLFAGSKMYMLKGTDEKGREIEIVRGKGFSRLTATRFMELLEGHQIDHERMMRFKERLRHGTLKPQEATMKKRVHFVSPWSKRFNASKHVVPKRFPYPDGSTRPWQIEELQEMLGKQERIAA